MTVGERGDFRLKAVELAALEKGEFMADRGVALLCWEENCA